MNGGKWLIENCPSERNLAKESQIKGFLSLSLFFQKEKKKKKKIHALKHRKFQMLWHFLKEINFQGLSNSMYLNKELTSSAYLKSRWCGK